MFVRVIKPAIGNSARLAGLPSPIHLIESLARVANHPRNTNPRFVVSAHRIHVNTLDHPLCSNSVFSSPEIPYIAKPRKASYHAGQPWGSRPTRSTFYFQTSAAIPLLQYILRPWFRSRRRRLLAPDGRLTDQLENTTNVQSSTRRGGYGSAEGERTVFIRCEVQV